MLASLIAVSLAAAAPAAADRAITLDDAYATHVYMSTDTEIRASGTVTFESADIISSSSVVLLVDAVSVSTSHIFSGTGLNSRNYEALHFPGSHTPGNKVIRARAIIRDGDGTTNHVIVSPNTITVNCES